MEPATAPLMAPASIGRYVVPGRVVGEGKSAGAAGYRVLAPVAATGAATVSQPWCQVLSTRR
ncbi:hypothetical protein GCM10018791_70320 [Streptomyces zaomyceticus]|nr:hypothetical protein GCM10018791_70320 [Streptomyces zaomyceticus]